MYLNIASYLYGKQIKSKMGKKLYLQMIFICVRLNWLDIHECHTMPLNRPFRPIGVNQIRRRNVAFYHVYYHKFNKIHLAQVIIKLWVVFWIKHNRWSGGALFVTIGIRTIG